MDNGNAQNFELDQFNLDTTSEDWTNGSPEISSEIQASIPERDQRALGNAAVTAADPNTNLNVAPDTTPQPDFTSETSPQSSTPELGQIIPMTMPEGHSGPPISASEETSESPSAKTVSFRYVQAMKGDRLKNETIEEIQNKERKLFDDGDIAAFTDFYNAISDEFQSKEAAWLITPVSVFFTTIVTL